MIPFSSKVDGVLLYYLVCDCGCTRFIKHGEAGGCDSGKQTEIMQCRKCKKGFRIITEEIANFHEEFVRRYPHSAESFEQYYTL
jgi:hypothetical protein